MKNDMVREKKMRIDSDSHPTATRKEKKNLQT